MSSGWPPEEDDRWWEPVRHASVVGAGHDSGGADRGYLGYAGYPPDADESGGSGPSGVPPSHDEDSRFAPSDAPGPADTSHPSGPLPGTHGYGGIGGAGLYRAPVYAQADYKGAGPGDTQYEDGPCVDEQYGAAPYGEAEYGPAGYGQAHRPGAAHYAGVLYDRQPYAGEGESVAHYAEDGYAPYDPDGSHPDQQAGYQPGGYAGYQAAAPGRVGSGQPDSGHRDYGYQDYGYQDYGYQDYGHQDYGDPRYDDPGYGDLTYDDMPHPGSAHRGATQPGPPYADEGHVELCNYHPGAAAATQGFLGAPAPVGTLDATGIDPPGYLDDPARGDHGIVLDAAEAGDAAGVLEGGSGFFDDAAPAQIAVFDLPAESQSRGGKTGGTGALLRPRPSSRPAGRRRGRSGDRRLWFALGAVVVVFVGAIVAIVMVAFPSGSGGPAHTLVTPDQLNAFTRRPALEQQMNVAQLRQDVVTTSSGQARHVVEAVYEAGNSTSGSTPQIILFIGGNLLNASPQVSVTSFTQRFKGARITSAGGLGEAACVNATASQPGSVAMCAWFDNDSFGEVVSPTMNASALADTMRQIRPHVELVAKR
jgi:hypothetical protein